MSVTSNLRKCMNIELVNDLWEVWSHMYYLYALLYFAFKSFCISKGIFCIWVFKIKKYFYTLEMLCHFYFFTLVLKASQFLFFHFCIWIFKINKYCYTLLMLCHYSCCFKEMFCISFIIHEDAYGLFYFIFLKCNIS